MSPYFSSCDTRLRSPYLRYCLPPALNSTKLAPGCTFMPFLTRLRSFSILCLHKKSRNERGARSRRGRAHMHTRSGKVRILATSSGTPTSSMRRLGSGEMTVRPLKSTRFPALQ